MSSGIVLNCTHCGRPIIGQQVMAGGFFYHFECARSPYAGCQPSPGCVSVPVELLQRVADILGGRWTTDSYGGCSYCGQQLGKDHQCELFDIEREIGTILSGVG